MTPSGVCLSHFDLFHLIWPSLGPFMLLQMASFHFFSDWAIFLCVCVCVCVCVCKCMCARHIFFIRSSGDGHLSCFHVLTNVNSAAVNIGVQVSFWIRVFIFSRYVPRNRIAESYGNSIFSFVKICVLCVSRSVASNSLGPLDYSPPISSVHGISQARILEWITIPFSRGSSWPQNQTWVSCIAGRFFTIWATGETLFLRMWGFF